MTQAISQADSLQSPDSDEVAEARAAVAAFERSSDFAGVEDDMRGPIEAEAVTFLRKSEGRLASAIESAFGESEAGVLLYECRPCSREIHTTEFEDVRFFVDNVESEAEAVARVREVLAGIEAAGVAG